MVKNHDMLRFKVLFHGYNEVMPEMDKNPRTCTSIEGDLTRPFSSHTRSWSQLDF